jgi:hypothetical protein
MRREGLTLRKMEHIHGHLCNRYSFTDNQIMVATVKLSKYLNLITWTVHFSCTPSICAVKLHWPDILYYWQKALGSSRSIMMACITNSFIKILSQYQVKQNGSSKVYSYYHDFIDRELLLSRKILSQLFLVTTSTVLQSRQPTWSNM